jgi:hypothetical protein
MVWPLKIKVLAISNGDAIVRLAPLFTRITTCKIDVSMLGHFKDTPTVLYAVELDSLALRR